MGKSRSIKRLLLYMVVGGVVLAALLGIYVLLFGTFGEREMKILLTTLGISYFSVTSLACAAAYERKRHPLLSVPGLILSIAGFGLFLPGLWAEWWRSMPIAKTTIILAILSFSFAHACLLSFAAVQRRFAWVFYAAVIVILGLAAIISGMIISEPRGDWAFRIAGAMAIVDGCLSLCVPILHRLGGDLEVPITEEAYQRIELVCPRCGQRGTYFIGSIRCSRCSLEIEVGIKDSPTAASLPAKADA